MASAARMGLSYDETLRDMEETLGLVPGWFKALPEEDLIAEWPTFKKYAVAETAIPAKYRELIGLAIAANIKCPYCQAFHKGAAEMNGATEAELSELFVLASTTSRYSAMLHAQHYDMATFLQEFEDIGKHLSGS